LPSFTLAEILLVVGLIGLVAALNGWALEVGAADGSAVDVAAAGQHTALGSPSGIGFVGSNQATVSSATKSALSAVRIDWARY
jgi:aspartate aminotransferase-like enzyme